MERIDQLTQIYIIYIKSKYGNDIRNAGVNFRRFRANRSFELDVDPLYFYGFYIWGLLNIGLKKIFISRTRKR